jgi:glycosyltransferase involved in cell wall biosynthesis
LVVPDHDWKAMGGAILKLIQDPELANRIGTNARQNAIDNFDWLAVSKRVAAVYASLLNQADCQDDKTYKTVSSP